MKSLTEQINDICILMDKREYKKAEVWIDKILLKFPNDKKLNTYKALILHKKGNLEESLNIYMKLLERWGGGGNDYYLKNIIYIYFELGNYEECLKYISVFESRHSNDYNLFDFDVVRSYSEFCLGKELTVGDDRRKRYVICQIVNYKESLAISHSANHYEQDLNNKITYSFSDNVDIYDLFFKVKDNIPNFRRVYGNSALAMYIVKVEKVGVYRGIYTDYLAAIAFPQSNQIITMYPVDSNTFFDESYVNHFDSYERKVNSDYSSSHKVKRLSQVEKFNNKYKNYKHE